MDTSKRIKRSRQLSDTGEPDAVTAQKKLKKRIQNRNSQKCYREKQLSYVRTLENIVNGVGGVGGVAGENELKLIRKNKELQDALLRLRKRFLSMSSAAMVGAEDTIFQDILKGDSTPEQISDSSTGSETNNDKKEEAENGIAIRPLISDPVALSTEESLPEDPNILPYGYLNNSALETENIFSSIDAFQDMEIPSMFPFGSYPNLLATQTKALKPSRLQDLYVSFDVLGIEKSMETVMTQTSSVSELENSVALAVRVMLKQSPLLEDYFNLMGGVYAIERIILWRLNPTPGNRDKIPPPFKPTTLQQHFPDHHYSIDFLLWSELRDQLLLYMGEVNFEQLGMDCLLMLVQDVPHLNLALPSIETCYRLVESLKVNVNQAGMKSLEAELGLDAPREETVGAGQGHKMVHATLRRYRLDNLVERRLSPRFMEKYPFLDLTSITTNYPVASFLR